MTTLYYPPFRADSEEELLIQSGIGLRAYVEDLETFDKFCLEEGWRRARRKHKTERWPTIAAILEACQGVELETRQSRPSMERRRMPWDPPENRPGDPEQDAVNIPQAYARPDSPARAFWEAGIRRRNENRAKRGMAPISIAEIDRQHGVTG